jgi:hypothetical protein
MPSLDPVTVALGSGDRAWARATRVPHTAVIRLTTQVAPMADAVIVAAKAGSIAWFRVGNITALSTGGVVAVSRPCSPEELKVCPRDGLKDNYEQCEHNSPPRAKSAGHRRTPFLFLKRRT